MVTLRRAIVSRSQDQPQAIVLIRLADPESRFFTTLYREKEAGVHRCVATFPWDSSSPQQAVAGKKKEKKEPGCVHGFPGGP